MHFDYDTQNIYASNCNVSKIDLYQDKVFQPRDWPARAYSKSTRTVTRSYRFNRRTLFFNRNKKTSRGSQAFCSDIPTAGRSYSFAPSDPRQPWKRRATRRLRPAVAGAALDDSPMMRLAMPKWGGMPRHVWGEKLLRSSRFAPAAGSYSPPSRQWCSSQRSYAW